MKARQKYAHYKFLNNSIHYSLWHRLLRRLSFGGNIQLVNFAATFRCNSRCLMCSSWKRPPKKEMSLKDIEKIFSARVFKTLKLIKIMGGEPFMREDLPEIIALLKRIRPKVKITISTNGFPFARAKKQIDKCLKANPEIEFAISLDGDKKTHNKMRGINCYDDVIKTFKYLKKKSRKFPEMSYRISTTISLYNIHCFDEALDFAEKNKVYVGYRLAIDKGYQYNKNKKDSISLISKDIEKMKKYLKRKTYNYFKANMVSSKKRPVKCFAMVNSIYLDPYGNLCPCILKKPVVNLLKENVDEVWNSEKMKNIRKKVKKCNKCWTDCQSIPDIRTDYFNEKIWEWKKKFANIKKNFI